MTYYGFEIVQSTVTTDSGINVIITIPVHHTTGATRGLSSDPVTLTRQRSTYFPTSTCWTPKCQAEVSGDIIAADCRGSSCLKLCFRPFAVSRSSESSCLANLYLNLPTTALKLCTQEVLVLPETLSAIYFEDSTYLVTSRDADCKLFNYSRAAKKSGELIRGCRSCLLRPSCNGRIETPDGGCIRTPDGALVRIADPRTCQYKTGLTIIIQQHPLIRALFATLNEAKRNLAGVMIPEVLREQARSEMVEALRLNLIQLPEGSVDQEAQADIAKSFADQMLRKHTPFHWQAARSGPVQYVVGVMIALTVLTYIDQGCVVKLEGNARNSIRRRRRDGSDKNNWCGMKRIDERVSPPRYDTPYKKSETRPASYHQGSMGDDSFSGQIYLPPRVPETPLFD